MSQFTDGTKKHGLSLLYAFSEFRSYEQLFGYKITVFVLFYFKKIQLIAQKRTVLFQILLLAGGKPLGKDTRILHMPYDVTLNSPKLPL